MEKPPNRDFEMIGEWNHWFPDVKFSFNFVVGIGEIRRKEGSSSYSNA